MAMEDSYEKLAKKADTAHIETARAKTIEAVAEKFKMPVEDLKTLHTEITHDEYEGGGSIDLIEGRVNGVNIKINNHTLDDGYGVELDGVRVSNPVTAEQIKHHMIMAVWGRENANEEAIRDTHSQIEWNTDEDELEGLYQKVLSISAEDAEKFTLRPHTTTDSKDGMSFPEWKVMEGDVGGDHIKITYYEDRSGFVQVSLNGKELHDAFNLRTGAKIVEHILAAREGREVEHATETKEMEALRNKVLGIGN
jgi:hypothetical protein